MRQVNIHEAKTKLSELIAAVEAGEEVVIARAGKRVVRLVSEKTKPGQYREGGAWKDHGEWNEEMWRQADAEILAAFEDSINRPFPKNYGG